MLPDNWVFTRLLLGFGFAGGFLRLIQIVRRPETFSMGTRVVAVLFPPIDARSVRRAKPSPRIALIAVGVIEGALAGLAFMRAAAVGPVAPYAGIESAVRMFFGGAASYLFADSVARLLEGACLSFGLEIVKPQRDPILSTSLGEFWGRRWNVSVGQWLYENAFRPVAVRAGVVAGIMAAFAASALLHFVPTFFSVGLKNAAMMASFFLAHGVLVVAESKLGVTRLRPAFGWALTMIAFIVTAPLFVEPFLEGLGL
jgi:hypothetical protein